MAPNAFGERIRELRRQCRLTQQELANRIAKEPGVKADVTYISKIENGKNDAAPSENLIRALAKVLNAQPDELLDLAGKFDTKALQDAARVSPDVAILLRRLQSGKIPPDKIKKLLREQS